MANVSVEEMKTQLLTTNFTAEELEEELEKLRTPGLQQRVRNLASQRNKVPLKANTIELPPITNGDKTALVRCPTVEAVHWGDGEVLKVNREIKKSRNKTCPANFLQKRHIRRSKPCPPGALAQTKKKEEQDFKKEFICLGVHLTCWKDTANPNTSVKETQLFSEEKSKPDVINDRHTNEIDDTDKNKNTNESETRGPIIRPWVTTLKKLT